MPGGLTRRLQRGGPVDRPLRHCARARRGAVQAAAAEAVGQRVDEHREVRAVTAQRLQAFALTRRHRFGERYDQRHRLNAETRLDRLDLGAQQLGGVRGVARGCRRPDADGLHVAVDAVEQAVQPARALADANELVDRVVNEVTDHPAKRLWRSDRRHEAAARAWQMLREHRLDRLGQVAERLVKPAMQSAPEALGERGAGRGYQLLDPLEAELAKTIDGGRVQPQRGDRQ